MPMSRAFPFAKLPRELSIPAAHVHLVAEQEYPSSQVSILSNAHVQLKRDGLLNLTSWLAFSKTAISLGMSMKGRRREKPCTLDH